MTTVLGRASARKEIILMANKTEYSSEDKAKGEKGVTQEQVGSGKDKDPNNFANNPERAAEAGRKGGHESHKRD
jgi:general stress protein YciG